MTELNTQMLLLTHSIAFYRSNVDSVDICVEGCFCQCVQSRFDVDNGISPWKMKAFDKDAGFLGSKLALGRLFT